MHSPTVNRAPATPETIVVIGGGQAGGWVVRTLRKEGFGGRIVLIADERHLPYERPPLSKAVLSGEDDIGTVHLFPADQFAELNVDLWQPERATAIDPATRTVLTASGREIHYDRLVIAAGGAARKLPAAIVDNVDVAYLRTLDDAHALKQRLLGARQILVVGGGWIGLEVAATARKLGVKVVVIEGSSRLCARSIPPQISDFLYSLHRAHGVDILLNAHLSKLSSWHGDTPGVRALLADGRAIDADFAVAGIGLAPHTELAESAGLAVHDGITVDAYGRTSDPFVFSCGDIANHPNAWLNRRVRLESWANAQNQAIVTAKAVLGRASEPYADIPWFWSDQYDVNLQILGDIPATAELLVRGDPAARKASLFHVENGKVRGVISINAPRDLRAARKWMNQARPVDVSTIVNEGIPLA